jgi:hypothetical protein
MVLMEPYLESQTLSSQWVTDCRLPPASTSWRNDCETDDGKGWGIRVYNNKDDIKFV